MYFINTKRLTEFQAHIVFSALHQTYQKWPLAEYLIRVRRGNASLAVLEKQFDIIFQHTLRVSEQF